MFFQFFLNHSLEWGILFNLLFPSWPPHLFAMCQVQALNTQNGQTYSNFANILDQTFKI